MNWWVTGIIATSPLFTLPFVIGWFLSSRFKCKTEVELDCDIRKVWDGIQDMMKCPVSGHLMQGIGKLPSNDVGGGGGGDDKQQPQQWVEEILTGHQIHVQTTIQNETKEPRILVREVTLVSSNILKSTWLYQVETIKTKSSIHKNKKKKLPSCKITVSSITVIENGSWQSPLFRFFISLNGSGLKQLNDHLDLLATSLGADSKRT